jgi:hypothetical protein
MSRIVAPWQRAGAFISSAAGIVKEAGRFAIGPSVWGAAAAKKSSSLFGAIARRAAGPAAILGAFGLFSAARNLLGGGYSMASPNVAWGYTPGMVSPYTETPMTFGTANITSQNMAASGSLVFALHNSRKG